MNRRILLIGLTGALVILLLVGSVWAQASASFDFSWYVMAGGGGRAESGSYAANSTLGQAAVGPSNNSTYGMYTGYWQRWLDQFIFLPLIMK